MKTRYFLTGLLFVMSTVLMAQNSQTFYTNNGKLYDANQSEFIIRGVNNPHIWVPNESFEALDAIAATGCNTVRVVWMQRGSAQEFRKVIQRVVELKMVAIPEIHDATGKNSIKSLEDAARYWVKDSVKAVLNDYKKYIILNIANEWMASNDAKNWYKGYKSAVSIIRKAGLNHCILIDAAGWGQDLGPTKQHAFDLLKHDPDSNLIFAVHMYGSWNDNSKIESEIKYFINNKLTLVVGEFGYDSAEGKNNLGCRVDAPFLIDFCEKNGVGYMPWSWTGNNAENQWLDMVLPTDWKTPTEWGLLLLNSKNGIKNTSRRCSIFITD